MASNKKKRDARKKSAQAPISGDALLAMVRQYSKDIKNGRSPKDVLKHLRGEVDELKEEVRRKKKGKKAGKDGIRGEAIDIALCALDLIFVDEPETTDADILGVAEEKCVKWKRHYSDSIEKKEVAEPDAA